jgi:aminopeptidase N
MFAAVLVLAGLAVPQRPEVTTQLPRDVRPTHYEVVATPDAPALTFQGKALISIEVLEPTARITLNALDLTFSGAQLLGGPATPGLAPSGIAVDAGAQTATFTFASALPKGAYRLALDYTGKIATQAVGLFALDYETPAGRKRGLFTQFENSDARRFIPSWDEPSYKATFTLTVLVPRGELAVSNMPVLKRTDVAADRSRVEFAPSPRMSTYLLFLAVGELDRATTRAGETEIGVVTKKGALDQAAFALESSATVLREYNDYFGTPYPLPKLDNVAGPGRSQFFGAMENWGAIFSFEHILLLDPSISTEADRQGVFKVAAHEIAHQWFGNLVTMSWWDDLWLNEGFASWMSGRTTEKLYPEWNTVLGAVKERENAMTRDALVTTHPVVQHVETVEQASQAFDAITYEKGEAVIRMLEGYVGPEAWRTGVRSYMKRHAYGNTVSDDLWREVEAAAGKPITAIAHDFTLQPGVPLVRVSEGPCSGGARVVTLTQGEFSKDQPDKKPLVWQVPVILKPLGAGEAVRTLVKGGEATVSVPGCEPLIVNAGQSGYYRTLYSPPQFTRIVTSFASLPAVDQLGILTDTWALGRVGLQPASAVLELAEATPKEADPQIWGQIADTFASLDRHFRREPAARALFRSFAIARLSPILGKVGWTAGAGERAPVAILRNELIETLGALGDRAVIDEARRRYAAQAQDPSALPGPLRKTIVGVVARHADAATWDGLHAAARAEKTPLVRERLYFLLSSTEDEALARRALDLSLTAEPGATTSAEMISAVSREHPDLAFDFAMRHMAAVNERIDATSRSRYYARLAGESGDPAMLEKLKAYATAHLEAKSRRETETVVAQIKDRIRIRTQVLPAIGAWLSRNGD